MSNALHTAEIVHWAALCVMAIVYTARLTWLFKFKGGKDRSPTNPGHSDPSKGARYSLANVAMPWAMESTRTGFGFYLTFVLFHLGVVAGIGLAFTATFAATRAILQIPVVTFMVGGLCGVAFLIAVGRMMRRLVRPVMRLISTPDDYFSLAMLTVWFGLGACTAAHIGGISGFESEWILIAYLYLTSFFLLYVPFSKISHYLYYPFTRYWLGRALGHRGSMPAVRG